MNKITGKLREVGLEVANDGGFLSAVGTEKQWEELEKILFPEQPVSGNVYDICYVGIPQNKSEFLDAFKNTAKLLGVSVKSTYVSLATIQGMRGIYDKYQLYLEGPIPKVKKLKGEMKSLGLFELAKN